MQKSNELFPKHEACMIQEIPLENLEGKDVLIWNNEENKCYNVRNGYRLLIGYYEGENANQEEREVKL